MSHYLLVQSLNIYAFFMVFGLVYIGGYGRRDVNGDGLWFAEGLLLVTVWVLFWLYFKLF